MKAAGDGGGIQIPHGKLIVSKPITVPFRRFTLLGSGSDASRVIFRQGASLSFALQEHSIYSVRGLSFEIAEGKTASLLTFAASQKNGEVILRDITISESGGQCDVALSCDNIKNVTMHRLKIDGSGPDGTAVRFSGATRSALLTQLRLQGWERGLHVDGYVSHLQLAQLEVEKVQFGMVQQSGTKTGTLLLNESSFMTEDVAFSCASPVTMSIMNCRFASGSGKQVLADMVLSHPGLGGTVNGCDFLGGIHLKQVDHFGISGNLFRKGFSASHILIETKNLVSIESNRFSSSLKRPVQISSGAGRVLMSETE